MPIDLHCNYCGKHVRAPDAAAGQQGKCPYCHQTVYIPTPSDQLEPLDLAPVDEQAEREQKRLEAEATRFAARLASERAPEASPAERARADRADRGDPARSGGSVGTPGSGKVNLNIPVAAMVEEYAVAMAAGNLPAAEEYAGEIRRNLNRAEQAIERILNGHDSPDRLRGVPAPVLAAFFKQLRATP